MHLAPEFRLAAKKVDARCLNNRIFEDLYGGEVPRTAEDLQLGSSKPVPPLAGIVDKNKSYETDEFKVLEYGPKLIVSDDSLEDSGQSWFLPFPEDCKEKLSHHPSFQEQDWNRKSYFGLPSLKELEAKIGVPDFQPVTESFIEKLGQQFIAGEDGIRFNSGLFGVRDITLNTRIGLAETPKLKCSFYRTDYFTFRVMDQVHRHYEQHNPAYSMKAYSGQNSINAMLYPFISSIAINGYVTVDDGTRLMLVNRANSAAQFGKKLGVYPSVNEALTATDEVNLAGKGIAPSLSKCLERGLSEELGVSQHEIKNVQFTHLAMGSIGIGMGVYALVDTQLSAMQLRRLRAGPDRGFEVDGFHEVPLEARAIERAIVDPQVEVHVALALRRIAESRGIALSI